ncbi:hypothetical protein CI102_9465 [Trichoderma harzianum]|nr:hypothetical protein CI102_9465 [Trichoderma harzianum]
MEQQDRQVHLLSHMCIRHSVRSWRDLLVSQDSPIKMLRRGPKIDKQLDRLTESKAPLYGKPPLRLACGGQKTGKTKRWKTISRKPVEVPGENIIYV